MLRPTYNFVRKAQRLQLLSWSRLLCWWAVTTSALCHNFRYQIFRKMEQRVRLVRHDWGNTGCISWSVSFDIWGMLFSWPHDRSWCSSASWSTWSLRYSSSRDTSLGTTWDLTNCLMERVTMGGATSRSVGRSKQKGISFYVTGLFWCCGSKSNTRIISFVTLNEIRLLWPSYLCIHIHYNYVSPRAHNSYLWTWVDGRDRANIG